MAMLTSEDDDQFDYNEYFSIAGFLLKFDDHR